ncbi:uncharacterized protein K452DRAFT_29433 [Aplosporella prunicola CBS 121167]|uniref:ADP-ribosylglycohydrolase n=1 Tax=Aplosporella prunicola CBS 121167 TaxID=1176127 RepID=A0A6A6AVU4_9PEZI|nr:uncharacterized protein K452DRAFT_29433 [Aplosporella prunicola CBS 121167]KAF2135348.1 hypothetical protein K452DRAFT_29433 [Aplosporella prunicola CBS 121167]
MRDWRDKLLLGSWAVDLSCLVNPHDTNNRLAFLFCKLVRSALAASPDGAFEPCSPPPCKLDKFWLATDFAEKVSAVDSQTWSDGSWGDFSMLLERLRPYRDLEAWRAKPLSSLKDTDFALDAVEVVLWCFFSTDTLKEGAKTVERFHGDPGAVSALYGALSGAFYGYSAIPSEWVDAIPAHSGLDDAIIGICSLRDKQLEM